MSKKSQDSPIRSLHFSKRLYNALQKIDITTVEQLSHLSDSDLDTAPGIGKKSKQTIKKTQRSLITSFDGNDINWFRFWDQLGIRIVPNNINSDISPQKILIELPIIIKSILKQSSDDRLWDIIRRRYGLEDTTTLTLEELGIAFGVTAQRVQQLEVHALKELQEALIQEIYIDKDYHIHPQVIDVFHFLTDTIREETKEILREIDLLRIIQEKFEVDPDSVRASLLLILELIGIQRIRFDKGHLESLWGNLNSKEMWRIKWGIEKIDTLVTEESVSPIDKIDILVHLNKVTNKNKRLDIEELDNLISLCSSIEECSEGFYWGKFIHLRSRTNQIERILIEFGEPTHIEKITREINFRLAKVEKRTVTSRNLVNQMSSDERFVPIGRSGEWGLSSWSFNTENILDLMKQCLMVRNEPATAEEIYTYVSERRPVNRSSITSYLGFLDDFAKVDRNRWGLSTWSETKEARVWNSEQVAIFVERLFKKNNTRKIEYSIIKQALMSEAQVNPKQAQGMLNINPVIETEEDSKTGELYAIYQSDHKEKLKKGAERFDKRKKSTLLYKIGETARLILENSPGQQIALSEMVKKLQDKYNCPKKTAYSYISKLEFIEKFQIPNTRKKMCRLKVTSKSSLDEVDNIASPELRNKISRALSFLTINDVDIALFLLSKEFEATLKKYLKLAHKQGELHYLPSGTLSLNSMIDYVKKEKIINDKAVLHFLRQKRNDRSHGTMPKLEERRLMMKHAEVTAGMYIDYIKFFDDLSHKLV